MKFSWQAKFAAWADIAAASTVDLSLATGNTLNITGNTTITSFGTVDSGVVFFITLSGAPLLTHNATSLILPSAANIQAAAWDSMVLRSLGSGNWKCISYEKANGQAISVLNPPNIDVTYPAGETLSAWNVVFIENAPTTAQASSIQNIGDVTANTRDTFPAFWTGVPASTLKLNLAKTGAPSVALWVRIETDNAGSPSGTLVHANAIGTVAAASLSVPTSATEAVAVLPTTTSAQTFATGMIIKANTNRTLSVVNKSATCTATTCYIKNEFWVVLATAAFSWNVATFYMGIFAWVKYRVEVDSGGASYTATYSAATWPYNNTNINYVSGVSNSLWADRTLSIDSIATESLPADTTVTLWGSFTIPAGQKCHVVVFQWTYGSETVNASNYYRIGYYTINSTTRWQKLWNGSAYSAMDTVKVPYTTSTLFEPRVLSKTDADFSYKIDWHGIAQEAVVAADLTTGDFPKIAIGGIDWNQTGMTQWDTMYLSNTAWAITSSITGTNFARIWEAKSATKIQLLDKLAASIDEMSVSTDIQNEWYTVQTGNTWWTNTTWSPATFNPGGYWTFTGNPSGVSSCLLPWFWRVSQYSPQEGKALRIKWRLKTESRSSILGFWLCVTPAHIYTAQTDISNGLVRFVLNNSALYAHNSNGSTATSTLIPSMVHDNTRLYNTYEIIFTPLVDIKFYVNNVLVAMHNTNIPTTGFSVLAHWVAWSSDVIEMFPPILSFQI